MKKSISLFLLTAGFFLGASFLTSGQAHAQCVADAPTNLTAMPGPMSGQATLTWNQTGSNVSQYALVYGYANMPDTFGVANFSKDNRMFVVSDLLPGTTYSFQVWAMCATDGPATMSNRIKVTAMGSRTMSIMNTNMGTTSQMRGK